MGKFQSIRTDPPLPAYIGIPQGNGLFPVIIVFMHRPGVDDSQQKVVDDLVKSGYIGICQDSYRGGILRESYTDQTIFEDFEATLEYVKNKITDSDSNRIGAMGFCMGGRHVYLAAARYSNILKAVVSYYGFPGQGTKKYDTPIEQVVNMKTCVLGIFGKQDHLFPFSDVERFQKKLLNQSRFQNKIAIYDDVGHGFLNPFSHRHGDGKSAELAWKETINFFNKFV